MKGTYLMRRTPRVTRTSTVAAGDIPSYDPKIGARKGAEGGIGGAIATGAAILITGAIRANNPDNEILNTPQTQTAIVAIITGVFCAMGRVFGNWFKHRK